MESGNELSLIVPAHNAERFIEYSLKEYNAYFSKKFKKFEIIVVCNACTDKTYEKVLSLKNKLPLIVLNVEKRGKGNAVIVGIEHSTYEWVGFIDADNPYNLNEVINMLDYLYNYDMVIVTKFKRALKYQASFTRRLLSLAGALVFLIVFNMKFKDTQAGAKFMRRDLWKKLKRPFVCSGFEFDMELLYKASKLHSKVKEYYIKPNAADFSTVKARILPGLLYRLFKMRLLQ